MQRLFFILTWLLFSVQHIFADGVPSELLVWNQNTSILTEDAYELVDILGLIQSILLKVVLPVIVIGASLYIAYELFTAEGDESKMKKAWKSVAYTAIALIAIALSYALVSIISRISF